MRSLPKRYGFHLQKDGQVCHMGSMYRIPVRRAHKELRRKGWRGKCWAIRVTEGGRYA